MARKNIRLQYNALSPLTFSFVPCLLLVLGYLTNNWTTTHLFSVYRSSMTDLCSMSVCLVMSLAMVVGITSSTICFFSLSWHRRWKNDMVAAHC